MTTHGEFLHKALVSAGWQLFETSSSYPEFVRVERDPMEGGSDAAARAAAGCVDAIKTDHTRAPLSRRDRAMLDFVRKLAVARRELGADDLARLRAEAFTEHQILEVILVASLAEFANCFAEAIGLLPGESLREALFGTATDGARP